MMARRRKSKSLGEMGLTLLAIGVGVLIALAFLKSSPLTIMFEAFRPWAWLAVALGAFFLGLHVLPSNRGMGLDRTPVEPVFRSRRTAPPRTADQHGGMLIDDDIRNRWRPPERTPDATVRPTAWTQAVSTRSSGGASKPCAKPSCNTTGTSHRRRRLAPMVASIFGSTAMPRRRS
jgi:restriction system protein